MSLLEPMDRFGPTEPQDDDADASLQDFDYEEDPYSHDDDTSYFICYYCGVDTREEQHSHECNEHHAELRKSWKEWWNNTQKVLEASRTLGRVIYD